MKIQNHVCTILAILGLTAMAKADITGDTLQFWYRVTSVNYSVTENVVVPGYPQGFGIDASASFYFTNGTIVVVAHPADWTSGGFNGFTVTDLTKTAGFTSFSIGSFTGGVQPDLSFDQNSLTVNFTPGGQSNPAIDVTYTFLFTTTDSRPSLSISPLGSQVLVSWPGWATNFTLQCSTDLTTTNWITLTNTPALTGGQFQLPIAAMGAQAFYRLVRP